MRKTAIMQYLDFLDRAIKEADENLNYQYSQAAKILREGALLLLEIEKNDIIDAYDSGRCDENYSGLEDDNINGNGYFNNTFQK